MKKEMVYIGGGVGMVLLWLYIFYLFYMLKIKDCKVFYWYGGCFKCEFFYMQDFCEIEQEYDNFSYYIVFFDIKVVNEVDKWKVKEDINDKLGDGYFGFIYQVLYDNYLKDYLELEEIEYYFCGLLFMLQVVMKMFDDFGVFEENIVFDDFGS